MRFFPIHSLILKHGLLICCGFMLFCLSGCGGAAQVGSKRIDGGTVFVEVGFVGEKPVYLIYGERTSDSYETKHTMTVAQKMQGQSNLWLSPPGFDETLSINNLVVMIVKKEQNYFIVPQEDYDADAVETIANQILQKYETATSEELDEMADETAKLLNTKPSINL